MDLDNRYHNKILTANLRSARINHRQSEVLQGVLGQTTSYSSTEKPHNCKRGQNGTQSISQDELDRLRPTDRTWCTWPAGRDRNVWPGDRHLYRAGEQHGSGANSASKTSAWDQEFASKPDKRLLCWERRQRKYWQRKRQKDWRGSGRTTPSKKKEKKSFKKVVKVALRHFSEPLFPANSQTETVLKNTF